MTLEVIILLTLNEGQKEEKGGGDVDLKGHCASKKNPWGEGRKHRHRKLPKKCRRRGPIWRLGLQGQSGEKAGPTRPMAGVARRATGGDKMC